MLDALNPQACANSTEVFDVEPVTAGILLIKPGLPLEAAKDLATKRKTCNASSMMAQFLGAR
jgi:hypothetical protein